MKKIVLLFVFSFLFLTSKAQTSVYHPFPDSNASWCAQWGYCGSSTCNFGKATYALNGKVQINGKTYSRLNHYEESVFACNCFACNCTSSPVIDVDTTTFYIRQDTSQKQVWILNPTTGADTIFFDFNLKIGDTIDESKAFWRRNNDMPGLNYVIYSIDSILIDGQYRKQFNYQDGCSPTNHSMIEGLGTLHGLFFSPTCFEYFSYLNGFNQDGKILYGSQCSNILSVQNITDEISITLIPNPLINSSTLLFSTQLKDAEVIICDMLGKEMTRKKLVGDRMEIEKGNLVSGVYFVQVNAGEKEFVRKLMVE